MARYLERKIGPYTFARSAPEGFPAVVLCQVQNRCGVTEGSYMTMDGVKWFFEDGYPVDSETSADLAERAHGYLVLLRREGVTG